MTKTSAQIKPNRIFSIIQLGCCIALFYFLFWRVCMTTDWPGYEMNFHHPDYWNLGFFFNNLSEWAKSLGWGYIAVFRCYVLLSFLLYLWLFRLISPRFVWLLYCITLILGYIAQVNIIRYYLAFPMFAIGYYYICCRKFFLRGVLLLLIPPFIHTGIIPLYLLPALFWWSKKNNPYIKWILIVCTIALPSLFLSRLLPLPATIDQILGSYIERYQDPMRFTGIIYNFSFLAFWMAILICWEKGWHNKMLENPLFFDLYRLSLTPFFFVLLVFHSGGGAMGRFFFPFFPIWFGFLLYPLQFENGSMLFVGKLKVWAIVFMMFIWLYVLPLIWGANELLTNRLLEIEFLPF